MALSTKLLLQTVQRVFKCLGRVDDWLLRSTFSEKRFRARRWNTGMQVHFKSRQRRTELSCKSPSGETISRPSLCQICSI